MIGGALKKSLKNLPDSKSFLMMTIVFSPRFFDFYYLNLNFRMFNLLAYYYYNLK